jgi:hypothetical protein
MTTRGDGEGKPGTLTAHVADAPSADRPTVIHLGME